ncbi:MAG: AbrB/MazE/SpoVT family DNA-binding domain-containing protein [Solirubrobacteraceae bacterium]
MIITIDKAGRIVVPKALRDALEMHAGAALEIAAVDGCLEIRPVPTVVRLEQRDGVLVAVPQRPLPPLTVDQVRATLEQTRR